MAVGEMASHKRQIFKTKTKTNISPKFPRRFTRRKYKHFSGFLLQNFLCNVCKVL